MEWVSTTMSIDSTQYNKLKVEDTWIFDEIVADPAESSITGIEHLGSVGDDIDLWTAYENQGPIDADGTTYGPPPVLGHININDASLTVVSSSITSDDTMTTGMAIEDWTNTAVGDQWFMATLSLTGLSHGQETVSIQKEIGTPRWISTNSTGRTWTGTTWLPFSEHRDLLNDEGALGLNGNEAAYLAKSVGYFTPTQTTYRADIDTWFTDDFELAVDNMVGLITIGDIGNQIVNITKDYGALKEKP